MAVDAISACLCELDAFRGLTIEQIEQIGSEAERLIFRDGQVIAEAGADAEGAYVLVRGRARATPQGGGEHAFDVEPGSLLGELGMLTEHHFAHTITAEGDVRAIRIVREVLRRQMASDPALLAHFQSRLQARLVRVAIELRLVDERLATAMMVADTHAARLAG